MCMTMCLCVHYTCVWPGTCQKRVLDSLELELYTGELHTLLNVRSVNQIQIL